MPLNQNPSWTRIALLSAGHAAAAGFGSATVPSIIKEAATAISNTATSALSSAFQRGYAPGLITGTGMALTIASCGLFAKIAKQPTLSAEPGPVLFTLKQQGIAFTMLEILGVASQLFTNIFTSKALSENVFNTMIDVGVGFPVTIAGMMFVNLICDKLTQCAHQEENERTPLNSIRIVNR